MSDHERKSVRRRVGVALLLVPMLGLLIILWIWQPNGGIYWITVAEGRGIIASILRHREVEGRLPPDLKALHPNYHARDLGKSPWYFYSEGDQFWLSCRSHNRHSVTYISGTGWWLNLDDGSPSTHLIPRIEPGDRPLQVPP